MAEIKGVVFDSDGTLFQIDSFIPLFRQMMRKALSQCSGRYDYQGNEDLYSIVRLPPEESARELKKLGANPQDFWMALFMIDLEKRQRVWGSRIKAFEDTNLLKGLAKKYSLGLLSNTPERIIDFQLKSAKLEGIWSGKVCGFYKCPLCKPGTAGLRMCLKQMGIRPQEAVVVGDSDIDVEAGNRAGTRTIRIERGHYDYGGPEPDFTIRSLAELEAVLCRM